MATEKYANNAITTLNGAINNSTTSIIVTSASLFPTTGQFRIIIESEKMLVTAVSGTTFTVTRGIESSSAVSHSSGVDVTHILTKGALDQIISDNNQYGTLANLPSAEKDGRLYFASDTLQLYRDNGSSWVAVTLSSLDFPYTFSTTTTDADPGDGTFRFDNASYNIVSLMYIDLKDGLGRTITAFLESWDDARATGNSGGNLSIVSAADPNIFVRVAVGTVTTASGYRKITAGYVSSNGTLPTTTNGVILRFDMYHSHNHDVRYLEKSINSGNVFGRGTPGSPGTVEALAIDDGLAYETSLMWATNVSPNALINGDGKIFQRQIPGTDTARTDATYGGDRWCVLTQTASINTKRVAGTTTQYAHRLTQSQASAQRMGYAQWVEASECMHFTGRNVSFQGKLRCSSSQPIRFAIFGWSGTADAPTRDVVNSWTNSTYTAGNFFISTSFSEIAVSSTTPTANTWTNFSVAGGTVTGYNNYGVMVWTEGTAAQNVTLDLSELQLLPGSLSSGGTTRFKTWLPRPYTQELGLCQRFFEKSTDPEVVAVDGAVSYFMHATAVTVNFVDIEIPFKQPKIKVPTMAYFRDSNGATAGKWAVFGIGGTFIDWTSNGSTPGLIMTRNTFSIASGFAFAGSYIIAGVWTADSEF